MLGRQEDTDVVSPVPRAVWESALLEDPDALPTQQPAWLDAVVAAGRWTDASRLYEAPGRPADRAAGGPPPASPAPLGVEASMPTHWGFGGIVADGGVTAADVRLVLDDLAARRIVRQGIRPNPRHGRLYAEARARGAVTIARRAHVLDLAGGVDVVWKGFSDSRRRAVRKAERAGIEVECDATGRLLPEFFELYARSEARWAEQQHEPARLARFRTRVSRHARQVAADRRASRRWLPPVGGPSRGSAGGVDHRAVRDQRALHAWRDGQGARRARCGRTTSSCGRPSKPRARSSAGSFHLGESGGSASLADYKERFGARPFDYPELRLEQLPITRADHAARAVVKRVIGFQD